MPPNIFKQPLDKLDIAVFDLETTGLSPTKDHILQIALVHINNGALSGRECEWKINPGNHIDIPEEILALTGLDEKELRTSPHLAEIFPLFGEAVGNSVVAGHNVKRFDLRFIRSAERRFSMNGNKYYIDTCLLSRRLNPNQTNHKLETCARAYGLEFDSDSLHDALADTRLCARLLLHQFESLRKTGVHTFKDLITFLS